MVTDKELTLLNLRYQDYLTYIGVIWTVAVSFFVAVISYLLTTINTLSTLKILIWLLILIFIETAFISVYFFLDKEKNRIKNRIYLILL